MIRPRLWLLFGAIAAIALVPFLLSLVPNPFEGLGPEERPSRFFMAMWLLLPVLMLLPMHFAASIARAVSPITAVIVVVSGMANLPPVEVVKRTAIPMAGALIVNVAATFFFFY